MKEDVFVWFNFLFFSPPFLSRVCVGGIGLRCLRGWTAGSAVPMYLPTYHLSAGCRFVVCVREGT